VTERGLLPFAPPPYRSEALYSWLRRLARPYGLEPWQLLHELGVGPFAEPHARYRHPVQSNLNLRDLRQLARLTRIDPSRLGLDRLCPPEWTLVSDEWCIGCPECERDDQRRGMSSFERAAWRSAACTLCLQHRTPLLQMIPATREHSDVGPSIAPLTTLEKAVSAQIFAFERDIGCALRGIAPARAEGTLKAGEFLMVLQDLLTFAVERWETPEKRTARTLDQHAMHMRSLAPTLFDNEHHRKAIARPRADGRLQLRHIASPGSRRAALWLALEVVWHVPAPRPRLTLRLGETPQDQFFGSVPHAGWDWLWHQAQAWPAQYRERHWHGFVDASDTSKGTVDINEGTN
jgi:TniQ